MNFEDMSYDQVPAKEFPFGMAYLRKINTIKHPIIRAITGLPVCFKCRNCKGDDCSDCKGFGYSHIIKRFYPELYRGFEVLPHLETEIYSLEERDNGGKANKIWLTIPTIDKNISNFYSLDEGKEEYDRIGYRKWLIEKGKEANSYWNSLIKE